MTKSFKLSVLGVVEYYYEDYFTIIIIFVLINMYMYIYIYR